MTYFNARNKRKNTWRHGRRGSPRWPASGVKLISLLPLCCPQDEMEELRSEMLEMRDMYMEDDVYQLQELRQQLEQVGVQADVAPR